MDAAVDSGAPGRVRCGVAVGADSAGSGVGSGRASCSHATREQHHGQWGKGERNAPRVVSMRTGSGYPARAGRPVSARQRSLCCGASAHMRQIHVAASDERRTNAPKAIRASASRHAAAVVAVVQRRRRRRVGCECACRQVSVPRAVARAAPPWRVVGPHGPASGGSEAWPDMRAQQAVCWPDLRDAR
jgi:hypothetical protein